MQAPKTFLQALASDDSEKKDLIDQYEEWILERALKDCVRNAQAWEANKRNGRGVDTTNDAGAKRYWELAAAIEARITALSSSVDI